MVQSDLVIRGGTVIDGTGAPGRVADVEICDGRIVAIGRSVGSADHVLEAEGHIVTPGFIDGHTHLDAQMFWDPLGTSSCWHGVTTVVTGNCGFTLAPTQPGRSELVLRNLERAEDIPAVSLAEGISQWGWEHFDEYLDVVERLPKAINVAAYIGHSALRTWAMGERAFEETATPADLDRMTTEVRRARTAGAIGFSTSRSNKHLTADDRPVASRVAAWSEVVALVTELAESGGGVFEIANEAAMSSDDPSVRSASMDRLRDLTIATGVTTTFGTTSFSNPDRWREQLDLLTATGDAGGRMFGQTSCRESDLLYSFHSHMPFEATPAWSRLIRSSPTEQISLLRTTETRRALVDAARSVVAPPWGHAAGGLHLDQFRFFDQAVVPNRSVVSTALALGVDPIELMIDRGLDSDLEQLYSRVIGNADLVEVEAMLIHPSTVMTFSGSGAHVGIGINASLPTNLLSYWVREAKVLALEDAIRMLTSVPAGVWGIPDRGLLRPGYRADVNVIDPDRVQPNLPRIESDLPGGAKRFTQTAEGILATIVEGSIMLRDGAHTGALPGRLLRNAA
jgi:N-acyl-D-amino-acid deacylase